MSQRSAVAAAYRRRWGQKLAVAAQGAFAASLCQLPTDVGDAYASAPLEGDVLSDARRPKGPVACFTLFHRGLTEKSPRKRKQKNRAVDTKSNQSAKSAARVLDRTGITRSKVWAGAPAAWWTKAGRHRQANCWLGGRVLMRTD